MPESGEDKGNNFDTSMRYCLIIRFRFEWKYLLSNLKLVLGRVVHFTFEEGCPNLKSVARLGHVIYVVVRARVKIIDILHTPPCSGFVKITNA